MRGNMVAAPDYLHSQIRTQNKFIIYSLLIFNIIIIHQQFNAQMINGNFSNHINRNESYILRPTRFQSRDKSVSYTNIFYSPVLKSHTSYKLNNLIQAKQNSLTKTQRTNSFTFLYNSINSYDSNNNQKKKKVESKERETQFHKKESRNPQNKISVLPKLEKRNTIEHTSPSYKKINFSNTKISFSKNIFCKQTKTKRINSQKQNSFHLKKEDKFLGNQSNYILKQNNSIMNNVSPQRSKEIIKSDRYNKENFYLSSKKTHANSIQNFITSFHQSMNRFNQPSLNKLRQQNKHANELAGESSLKLKNFILGRRLGKGNFGEVFVAKNKSNGFTCAIKIIPKSKIREEKVEEQIIRELKIHSFVKHMNIIEMYGFFSDENNIYILQQLCTDGQLYDMIKKRRRITESQTAYIIRQILEGVWYLHENKILHRDIKPQNILIQKGIAKICDFGWAVYSNNNLQKSICGTPLYFSPEIIRRQSYNQKIDVWAIGMIAYELLMGRVPFNVWCQEQLTNIVNQQVEFPQFVDISPEAKDFILKMLEKDPRNRISILDLFKHPFLLHANSNKIYQ